MLMQRLSLFEQHSVLAIGQDFAQLYDPRKPCAMIRIKSADCSVFHPLKNPGNYVSLLEIEFDDIDSIGKETVEEILERGFTVFTASHARQIVDFFEANPATPLVAHCAAGLSRSPAVGIAFAYFKRDLAAYEALKVEYPAANTLVLNELKAEIDRRSVSAGLDPFETDVYTAWLINPA